MKVRGSSRLSRGKGSGNGSSGSRVSQTSNGSGPSHSDRGKFTFVLGVVVVQVVQQ